jgi:hypothetical protein
MRNFFYNNGFSTLGIRLIMFVMRDWRWSQKFGIGKIRTRILPIWIIPIMNLVEPYTVKPNLTA